MFQTCKICWFGEAICNQSTDHLDSEMLFSPHTQFGEALFRRYLSDIIEACRRVASGDLMHTVVGGARTHSLAEPDFLKLVGTMVLDRPGKWRKVQRTFLSEETSGGGEAEFHITNQLTNGLGTVIDAQPVKEFVITCR